MIRIILLLLFSSSAYCASEKMTITFTHDREGGGYIYEIDMSSIPGLPEWNTNQDPPLSIKSALTIAQAELKAMKFAQKMKFSSIRLSSASIVGKHTVWYYSVTYINDATHRRDGFIEKTIHILMNGDILKPRKISKEEHEKWFR